MSAPVPTREGYDLWSEHYDDYANPLIRLEEPHVRELLGDVGGLAVLDLGCGTGRHAHGLAAAGARVTALDFSEGMLAQAQAKPGAESITYQRHDLHEVLPFEDASFDRAVHALALDHLDDPVRLLGELRRVLRPGGHAVVSVMHPAMFLKGTQARFVDPRSGELVTIENRRYTIADYVMAAREAQLDLDHVGEHECDEATARGIPRAEKYVGWPMLLVLRLVRRDD